MLHSSSDVSFSWAVQRRCSRGRVIGKADTAELFLSCMLLVCCDRSRMVCTFATCSSAALVLEYSLVGPLVGWAAQHVPLLVLAQLVVETGRIRSTTGSIAQRGPFSLIGGALLYEGVRSLLGSTSGRPACGEARLF